MGSSSRKKHCFQTRAEVYRHMLSRGLEMETSPPFLSSNRRHRFWTALSVHLATHVPAFHHVVGFVYHMTLKKLLGSCRRIQPLERMESEPQYLAAWTVFLGCRTSTSRRAFQHGATMSNPLGEEVSPDAHQNVLIQLNRTKLHIFLPLLRGCRR